MGTDSAPGQRLGVRGTQQAEQCVDRLLVGLGHVPGPLAHDPVGTEAVGQAGEAKRLDEIVHRTQLHGGAHVGDVAGRRDDDGVGPVVAVLLKAAKQRQPVLVGQVEIEEQQVRSQFGDGLPGCGRGVGNADDLEARHLGHVGA